MQFYLKYIQKEKKELYIKQTLDIAAIWTVADCMKLVWENRIIVSNWLKQIKFSRSSWIKEMLENNSVESIDCDTIWFDIAPRLNSAWRLDSPIKAVNVLLNKNPDSLKNIYLK